VASAAPTPAKPSTDLKSTQGSLLISEIKDGVVVMRDGSLRAVILSSAINFDLMSEQEQGGIEYAYQSFLNSLHFPVQIVVKSQKIDLDSYIEDLTKRQQAMDNQLLAGLMEDYISNIKGLIEEVNIMDKQFFVVIPHFPAIDPRGGNVMSTLIKSFKPSAVINMGTVEFEQAKTELAQRVQLVSSGLTQMGLRAIPLNTQELIELYYASYNPDVAANQKLIDAAQLQTAAITRGSAPAQPAPVQPLSQPAPPTPITVPQPVQPAAPVVPQQQMAQPVAPIPPQPMTAQQPTMAGVQAPINPAPSMTPPSNPTPPANSGGMQ
jgi:hypothetical protein